MKYEVIINSRAGKGRAVNTWKEVEPAFCALNYSTSIHMDDYTNDFIRDLEDCDGIIAVGGDGTFHNVVNSLLHYQRKIPLGFIPAGSGNALMMDLDCLNPPDAVQRIISGQRRSLDVIEVTTAEETKYAISVVGWGLFSTANQRAEKLRWLGGCRYNVGALWDIIFKHAYPAKLIIGDKTEEGEFITIFASNTKHTGKAMKAAPTAKIDDGLIELVTVRNGPRLKLLASFKSFLEGKYLDNEFVTYRQLSAFELRTDVRQSLAIDGETTGSSPFSARVLPNAIELLM